MHKRPTSADTENEILQMQKDFLQEKSKNANFQPAAKVVRLQSQVPRQQSKFARFRALSRSSTAPEADPEGLVKADTVADPVLGDIIEKQNKHSGNGNTPITPIIGDIIERAIQSNKDRIPLKRYQDKIDEGFPKPIRIQRSMSDSSESASLFALSRLPLTEEDQMEVDIEEPKRPRPSNFGHSSYILKTDSDGLIHKQNVERLQQMDEHEILLQRQQLLQNLDPSLIQFLQSKRRASATPSMPSIPESEQSSAATAKVDEPDKPMTIENESTLEIIENPNYHNWPNFDVVEPSKLEWMKDITASLPTLKPGEVYEARFDWKGILLPYLMPNGTDVNRELYLHGDDAERPGYTLQELFRLARSNIVQQRISAINSIAGILNIYNQGFYDTVLEVPISKIFFLLRFAFDDNIPAILEVTSKALATLFYHDSDEILLDFTHECSVGFLEPALALPRSHQTSTSQSKDEELNKKFAKIDINNPRDKTAASVPKFQTNIDEDEEESRDSLNDFHLAEIDLIDCFLRTNIVQRINYILTTVQPENSTVVSCLKILIRLARTDRSTAESLFENDLLKIICDSFLPTYVHTSVVSKRFYNQPQYLALKLLRIIGQHSKELCDKLTALGIEAVLKNYIFIRSDITIEVIKLQIEAYRLTKVLLISNHSVELYNELTPALLYMLEWCFQFMKFEQTGHLIFRQHAAALITLIGCEHYTSNIESFYSMVFTDKLQLCFSKWFQIANVNGIEEFSQTILLAACLDAISLRLFDNDFNDFYHTYLLKFLNSQSFAKLCTDLIECSPLLSRSTIRTNKHTPLPNLDSVIVDSTKSPNFLLSQKYPIYLLNSLAKLLNLIQSNGIQLFTDLAFLLVNQSVMKYLEKIAENTNRELRKNWYIRSELAFLLNLIKSSSIRDMLDRIHLQKIAYALTCYLTEDQIDDVVYLFDNIFFDKALYLNDMWHSKESLDQWKAVYAYICLLDAERPIHSLTISNHNKSALSPDWPYKPLLLLLQSITNKSTDNVMLHERDLITACISFTTLQIENNLHCASPTEELIFLMVAFLGPQSTFLEPDMNELLAGRVRTFFHTNRNTTFSLDERYEGNVTFENLYILFLDHFQGVSYGNETFSALVMVPLSQKYDLKWRLMVWSEHPSVLRFIRCNESDLIGPLDDYLEPVETDVNMLKSYYQALCSITFSKKSIVHRIGSYHLQKSNLKIVK